ncbi:hypothetical protein PTKIN_Ptkin01aG0026900 [Pterospermum kingtungense]
MWNISLGESKVLPDEPTEPYVLGEVYREIYYGFGYDSFNNDYKLVRIVQDELSTYDSYSESPPWFSTEVKVYSLKTNSWRSCEQIPNYHFSQNYWGMEYYTFVCGALHWLGTKEIPWWRTSTRELIIAFDVATEKHHPIELPNGMEDKRFRALGAFRGCLCAIIENGFKVYIWVMKDYGVKESWTMMHCLPDQSQSVVYLKLLWYDVKGEEFKDEDFPQHWKEFDYFLCPKAVICTESFVKLC